MLNRSPAPSPDFIDDKHHLNEEKKETISNDTLSITLNLASAARINNTSPPQPGEHKRFTTRNRLKFIGLAILLAACAGGLSYCGYLSTRAYQDHESLLTADEQREEDHPGKGSPWVWLIMISFGVALCSCGGSSIYAYQALTGTTANPCEEKKPAHNGLVDSVVGSLASSNLTSLNNIPVETELTENQSRMTIEEDKKPSAPEEQKVLRPI